MVFLAGPIGARAQEVAPATATVEPAGFRSYADVRPVVVEEELASLREGNSRLAGSTVRKAVTFVAAVAKARGLATSAVPPLSLAGALKALPNNEPTTLRLFAFAQLAKARPSVAFAVLVAAYDRNPESPDALADLAGMLAGFGYANEAIAILDELARRQALPSPPMGISGRDAVDYIRGYALVRLGDIAAAKPLLTGVAERQPQLAEAARMLAIISEDPAEQRKYLLLGVWRHRSPLMVCAGVDLEKPEPDAMIAGGEVAIDVRSIIDPAKGKRGKQPSMHYAKGVPEANDLKDKMDSAMTAASERGRMISESQVRPEGYIRTDNSLEEKWGSRMDELISSIGYRDTRLRELDRQRHVLWNESAAAGRKITNQRDHDGGKAQDAYMQECLKTNYEPTFEQIGEKARPAHEAAMAQIMPYINREELAERAWFDEWHFVATALAAQVGDADWHEYIRLTIERERWNSYSRLLFLVGRHAGIGGHSWITKEPGQVSTEPEAAVVEKCDGTKSVGFSTKELPGGQVLPFEFGVEMTCEGMSLEASVDTRIPGISLSAEIGGDNQGSFTAFVGPKAEAVLGDKNIAAFTASAKAGAYVTGNKEGVTDAGVKYEVKVGGKIGAFSAAQKVAEGNVSFFPAPSPSGGDFGPLVAMAP